MADFPAALPNIPNAGTTLGTTGGASSHLTIHTRIEEELLAVATRLGATSVAAMTLASLVTAYGSGWLSPSSSLSAGMVVTRGRIVNGTGSTQVAGTAVAQLSSSLHWPTGNLSFTSVYGSTVAQVDVNSAGQLVLTAGWPAGQILNVGGFVWWL